MDFSARARKIKAVILDVDGVLTDGRLGYDGERVIKHFDVRDGHAIKMAMRTGMLVGILSGRKDASTTARAEDLGLSFAFTGQRVKLEAFARILENHELTPEACAYVGDDVVDIPVMRKVGLPICVADADEMVVPHAVWRTKAPGGRGAVREVLFRILREQGQLDNLMARYLRDEPS